MRKIYSFLLSLFVVFITSFSSNAQHNYFSDISERAISLGNAKREIIPLKFRTVVMDKQAIKNFLWSLPNEEQVRANHNAAPVLEFPKPDGTTARFHVWESSIMEPGLEAKFPEMKTFAGQGIDDPYATIRFDYNPYFGFHAQVLSVISGSYYIDPYAKGNIDNYISYFKKDNQRVTNFICETPENIVGGGNTTNVVPVGLCRGTELYTYRLALACTGEYAVAVCSPDPPTVAVTAAAMLTTVNRIVGVYEKEVSIRMVLVANNNDLIYLDGTTDPYSNNNGSTMLGQNQANIDAVIGSANYDIGHVVSTGGGGVATLRAVCNPGIKARGVTGLTNPVGDAFDIDYVAHEMGHQWGGNHPFNGTGGNCSGGNRNAATAYEPGSGTTVMAYAGICNNDDIQPNSDPYFHTVSFDEISFFVENGGASCRVITPTGNTLPQITAMDNNGVSIPVSTPFTLNATATDANGDAITYNWEEWDLGPATSWNAGAFNSTSPLFKSRIPKTTGSRTFPDIAVIVANYPSNPPEVMGGLKGETLPAVARTMKFRLTVRDNRAGGGGVVTGGDGCQTGFTTTFQVNVIGTTPFTVIVPNGGESYPGNTSQTITWDVAGTDASPVSVANVKISLSTDGGLTYPTVLVASTPNDGTEALTIPNTPSTTARIRIEAVGNIFFDISNQNWNITAATSGFTFNASTAATVACSGPVSATVALGTTATGGFVIPINLTATSGVPAGTNVTFSTNPLAPGSSTNVTLNNINTLAPGTYNINIQGVAGVITQNTTVSFVVSPGSAPTITSQPAAQTVCAGANATFIVAATGTVTYQWQVSTGGGPFTNIAGATSASYTVIGTTTAQNSNQYHAIVSALCGSATSNNALLTINSAPAITTQPANVTTCAGQNATFTVAATGGGLTYQWQSATSCTGTFTIIAGAISATLNLNAVTAAMNGTAYKVVVTGPCGTATSSCVTLSLNNPVTISAQPASTSVCLPATNVLFNVTAAGTGLIYQWQVSTNGGVSFTNISGATGATFNLTPTAAMNGNQYQVVLSGTCTPNLVSGIAILTINSLVTIIAQPVATETCTGDDAIFSVGATSSSPQFITYQWQVSVNGGAFVNIPGATSSTLTVPGILANNGNVYHVIVSGPPCGSVISNNEKLTVNQRPEVSLAVSGSTSINPSVRTSLTATVTPSGPSYQYEWYKDGILFPNFNTSTIPVDVDGIGEYTVQVTNVNTGCGTRSNSVRITVLAAAPNVLFVYPNPSSGQFQVRNFTASTSATSQMITVYNSRGARVYQKRYPISRVYERMDVNLDNAASGIYFIELRDASGKRLATSRVMIR